MPFATVIPGALLAPIRTDADQAIFDAIASMFDWAKAERVISSDPKEYASFGLLPPRSVLVVSSAAQADTLFLGDASQIGSFVYARKASLPDVFLASNSMWTNTAKTLFDARDKSILHFEQSQVERVEIKTDKGLFYLSGEGGEWKIDSPKSCRADGRKVTELLNSAQNQKTTQFIEEEPHDLRRYGLDDPAIQLRIGYGSADAPKVLSIGKFVDGAYYAREEARLPVFTVDSSFVRGLRLGLNDLRDKKMVQFSSSQVNEIELTVGDSTFICRKDTAGNWALRAPVAMPARSWKISSLISDVELLTAEDFADDLPASLKPFGLDQPRIRCKLMQNGAAVADLMIGANKDAALLYAKTGSSATVYLTRRAIFDKLNVRLTDLADAETASPAASFPK